MQRQPDNIGCFYGLRVGIESPGSLGSGRREIKRDLGMRQAQDSPCSSVTLLNIFATHNN